MISNLNHQIAAFGWSKWAWNIEGWLKFRAAYLVYSQILLHLPIDNGHLGYIKKTFKIHYSVTTFFYPLICHDIDCFKLYSMFFGLLSLCHKSFCKMASISMLLSVDMWKLIWDHKANFNRPGMASTPHKLVNICNSIQ